MHRSTSLNCIQIDNDFEVIHMIIVKKYIWTGTTYNQKTVDRYLSVGDMHGKCMTSHAAL